MFVGILEPVCVEAQAQLRCVLVVAGCDQRAQSPLEAEESVFGLGWDRECAGLYTW